MSDPAPPAIDGSDDDVEAADAPLRPPSAAPRPAGSARLLGGAFAVFVLWTFVSALPRESSPPTLSADSCTPAPKSTDAVKVYLGNGCFWERQWAYVRVEKGFGRDNASLTAKVGYAGGASPPHGGTAVCYHTSDGRDYSWLGHAEAVQVLLDRARATEQMLTLAKDFFGSFQGSAGSRARPDPMDRGAPYRSFVGLPGGMSSPLFPVFSSANTLGMAIKPGHGHDADEFNTVWVYDSDKYPFFDGEVYHQFHSNFFRSEGMPYGDDYVHGLWDKQKKACRIVETGCPESGHW